MARSPPDSLEHIRDPTRYVKILLLRVAKGSNSWADQAVRDFSQRFVRKLPFEELTIKPASSSYTIEKRREEESTRILRHLKNTDRVIVLDERGLLWKTEELHKDLTRAMNSSTKRVVFVIGGPFGHAPCIRERAHVTLSLSKMVLNHELARICIVEQLYRVSTLIWGGDYHH